MVTFTARRLKQETESRSPTVVTFTARRLKQELVAPARATPRELKYLSDIDIQRGLRFYGTLVEFFRGGGGVTVPWRDPVIAIRSALAEALVYFYPVAAGRLRELPPDGRLVVECTAEGVMFVEADADVSLAELGEPLLPPYPCVDQLLCEDLLAIILAMESHCASFRYSITCLIN